MAEENSSPPPRVVVVTPYFNEPDEWIERCIESVENQTLPTLHLMVAAGEVRPWIAERVAMHLHMAAFNDGYGNTPRTLGAVAAFGSGADAISWLDADNWFEPDHINRCVQTWVLTKAVVVTSPRTLRRPDGSLLGIDNESDGVNFNDANCYLMGRRGIGFIHHWAVSANHRQPGTDRFFWLHLQNSRIQIARQPIPTVNYVTTYEDHFKDFGETPPDGAKPHRTLYRGDDVR